VRPKGFRAPLQLVPAQWRRPTEDSTTRHALLSLVTVAAVWTLGGCSGPEAPAALATPAAARPTPAPVSVLVQVAEGAGALAEAWADELRTAVSAGHGDLSLASAPETAAVVVRIDTVETGVDVASEPEGDGEISVMRGALVVDGSAREFNLNYRGEARPQAEALARNLRAFAAEGGTDEPADEPAADEDDAESETDAGS